MSLEELISTKLAALGLQHDEDTCAFVLGIVEEDSFEPEDKRSAILASWEAEDDEVVGNSLDQLLEETAAFREAEAAKDRAEEEARLAEKAAKEEARTGKKVLTPEEEARRRQELVKQYGFVEEEDETAKVAAKAEAESDVPFVDPRTLSKKARKKAEAGVDILMQPNMNAAIVKGAELQRRKEDATKAAAKREKDKGDLKKQKDDAAKKLADKQKKAQKGERKA